jgi:hypothetical protein
MRVLCNINYVFALLYSTLTIAAPTIIAKLYFFYQTRQTWQPLESLKED